MLAMENKFYRLIKETKSTECLTCGKKLTGLNSNNMQRHYKLMHRMDNIPLIRRKRKYNEKGELVYEPTQQEFISINQTDQKIKLEHCEASMKPTSPIENIENTETTTEQVMPEANATETTSTNEMPIEKVGPIYDKRIFELDGTNLFIKHKERNKTECLVCGRLLSGFLTANIKRHFNLVHNIEIKTKPRFKHDSSTTANMISLINEEDNSLESLDTTNSAKRPKLNHSTTAIDCNQFLKCCIGLVAVKGISASIFDDDEFFKILIAPQEEKFGTNLNSDDISTLLQRSSLTARDLIINKLKHKIVALKMDLATEANNNVLNISVQYIDHFKICHNTLDIIQFDRAETDFKTMVLKCLESYEINKNQVYCYTTGVTSKLEKANEHKENINEPEKEIDDVSSNTINDVKQLLNTLTTELHEVKSANSIIQLTVSHVLTEIETNLQYNILKRKLQTKFDSYQDGFILDNDTNWLSTYKMLETLQDNETNLEEEYVTTESVSLENKLDWNFVTDLITSLTPLVNLNKQLNNEQYIFGDFYRDWLNCEIELEDLFPSSMLARLFLKSMQKHKQELLEDEIFLAALYLDPRFNFSNTVMLSDEQKRKAEAHLVKQYKIMQTFKNHNAQPLQSTTTTSIDENSPLLVPLVTSEDKPSTSKKAYDKLAQRIKNLSAKLNDTDEPQRKFQQKLMFLLSTKTMAPLDMNVLDYWKNTNFDADITSILEAALTVPVTQVTIGRAANALWYSNEETIDRDLVLTKYNFKEINENYVEL